MFLVSTKERIVLFILPWELKHSDEVSTKERIVLFILPWELKHSDEPHPTYVQIYMYTWCNLPDYIKGRKDD